MTMNSNFREAAGRQTGAELSAKAILTARGVQPGLNHFYMDFARKMMSLSKRHKGSVLETEACIEWQKWSSRGLNDAALDEIMQLYLPGKSCIVMACDYPGVGDVDKGVVYAYGVMVGTLDRGLPWTGQTVVYKAGDDGTYQKGHTTDRPEPGARFTDNLDGTITDNATGLMWVKDGTGAGCNGGTQIAWEDAIDFCEALNFAGHTDWRLPNIKELISIMDYSTANPSVDAVFTNTPGDYTWTSTTLMEAPEYAWDVYVSNGDPAQGVKTELLYVHPVRGGKP